MMRKICAVWISFVILSIMGGQVMAQNIHGGVLQGAIASLPLEITFDKTTNLLFPYPIKSVDKGSKQVLAQLAKGVENILQVKAGQQGFAETNLTVVTAEGKLYSFMLNYTDNPAVLNIKVGSNINYPKADALFNYRSDNEARINDLTEQINSKKPTLKNISDEHYDVAISMDGVYIKDDKLYFQFALTNNSNVDYSVEAIRFYIRDKRKSKRTASQELELSPVQVAGNTEIIRGQSRQAFVIALDKFTIPDKKILFIELLEAGGGRHLSLKVQNKIVVGAKSIL